MLLSALTTAATAQQQQHSSNLAIMGFKWLRPRGLPVDTILPCLPANYDLIISIIFSSIY